MARAAYDASLIRPVKWAAITQNSDGTWTAVWHIAFQDQISLDCSALDELARACADEFFGFQVQFEMKSEHDLHAVVTTRVWSMDDPYYLLTYRMFSLLDDRAGKIEMIEGHPSDWWGVFHGGRRASPQDWDHRLDQLKLLVAGPTNRGW